MIPEKVCTSEGDDPKDTNHTESRTMTFSFKFKQSPKRNRKFQSVKSRSKGLPLNISTGGDDEASDSSGETLFGKENDNNESEGNECTEVNTIRGTNGDDVIHGTPCDDLIYAGEGDDTIYGGGGNDTIISGNGNDVIYVDGNDVVYAGLGDDTVHIEGSRNLVHTEEGNDFVYLDIESRECTIDGGSGNDMIWFGPPEEEEEVAAEGEEEETDSGSEDSQQAGSKLTDRIKFHAVTKADHLDHWNYDAVNWPTFSKYQKKIERALDSQMMSTEVAGVAPGLDSLLDQLNTNNIAHILSSIASDIM